MYNVSYYPLTGSLKFYGLFKIGAQNGRQDPYLKGVVEGAPLLFLLYFRESCGEAEDCMRIQRLCGPLGIGAALCEVGWHGSGGVEPGCPCTLSRGTIRLLLRARQQPHLLCLPELPAGARLSRGTDPSRSPPH